MKNTTEPNQHNLDSGFNINYDFNDDLCRNEPAENEETCCVCQSRLYANNLATIELNPNRYTIHLHF